MISEHFVADASSTESICIYDLIKSMIKGVLTCTDHMASETTCSQ